MNDTISPETYSLLCDLFERFGHGNFDTAYDPDSDQFLLTSPQARAFAVRAIEIMQSEESDYNV